jgi:hypothetical protein
MKQINNLIVVEVPKGVRYRVKDTTLLLFHMTEKTNHVELPPGQYEIIGLYGDIVSSLNSNAAKVIVAEPDMVTYFGIPIYMNYLHPTDWNASFLCSIDSLNSFVEANQLQPTETTDLLFLKKLN